MGGGNWWPPTRTRRSSSCKIDGDKHKRMVYTEVLTKKPGQIFEKLVGGRKGFAKRAQGKV